MRLKNARNVRSLYGRTRVESSTYRGEGSVEPSPRSIDRSETSSDCKPDTSRYRPSRGSISPETPQSVDLKVHRRQIDQNRPKAPISDRPGHATRSRAVYGIRTQLGSTDPSPRSMCPMLAIVPPQAEVGRRLVAIHRRLGAIRRYLGRYRSTSRSHRPTSSRSRSMPRSTPTDPRSVSVKRPARCGPSSASLRIGRIGVDLRFGSFAGARGGSVEREKSGATSSELRVAR
jgi:hypothetical protein